MSRVHGRRGVAGLMTIGIFGAVLAALGPARQAEPGQPPPRPAPRAPRPEGKPIPMPANLVGLEIPLGLKDKEPRPWDGEIQVSEGRVLDLTLRATGQNSVAAPAH